VRTALTGIGADDVECDTATKSCSFKIAKDVDLDAKLDELAKNKSNKLSDWSKK
jgi:hypothetical protein